MGSGYTDIDASGEYILANFQGIGESVRLRLRSLLKMPRQDPAHTLHRIRPLARIPPQLPDETNSSLAKTFTDFREYFVARYRSDFTSLDLVDSPLHLNLPKLINLVLSWRNAFEKSIDQLYFHIDRERVRDREYV